MPGLDINNSDKEGELDKKGFGDSESCPDDISEGIYEKTDPSMAKET